MIGVRQRSTLSTDMLPASCAPAEKLLLPTFTPLRRLIHSIIVRAKPGVKGFEVEIKGRLQELLGAPFLKRSVGGGLVVAGEGLEPPTPGL
jgi:hypothetical protein